LILGPATDSFAFLNSILKGVAMVNVELPELLCRVKFPLYSVQMISPRHIVFGGGGGAAKTGVTNGFEIFELSHNGTHCVAETVNLHKTGDFSVMNFSATFFDPVRQQVVMAVGHDEKTQTYALQLVRERQISVSVDPTEDDSDDNDKVDEAINGNGNNAGGANNNLRKRRQSVRNSISSNIANGGVKDAEFAPKAGITNTSSLIFNVRPVKAIQTDYNMPEPYQKVVRISPDARLMATGGDDGVLRVWTFPDLNPLHDIEAHQKEIDDLDFSPDNTKIASISKDRRALVWDVKKGKKHAEMGWDPPNKVKYAFKRLRFAKVEGDPKKYKVFTIVNPVGASKPPSYLQRWSTKAFTIEAQVEHEGALSALAVSDNGNFVATGSMFDGTVEVYIAFNLQKIKRVEKSHSTFITGLEFLPCGEESDAVRGFSDASVVSISVDHQVCIHHIPRLRKISLTLAGSILFLLLLATFVLCSWIGI